MSLMCGGGQGVELSADEQKANDAALKAAKQAIEENKKPIKMLLLGAGESGKSTIFKQMKIINKDGYTDKEKKEFVTVVHSNVCASVRSLLSAFDKLEQPIPGEVAGFKDEFETAVGGQDDKCEGNAEIIKKLWSHPAIKELYMRRSEFQLNDSAEFYFENIDEIAKAGYIPTEDHVLRSRVRTTGIVQSDFKIKGMDFAMFDVGGQRNERRKWIHCFDNVNAVVFVAALSEFDQTLFEDETMNRFDEALDLFAQIVGSKWFVYASIILFLNKKDLFEIKLKEKEAQGKKFADYVNKNEKREPYTGDNTMEKCAAYQKQEFLKRNKNPDKSIYSHITTAIDTSNVKFVFNAVVSMILEENLKQSGLGG